MPTSLDLDRPLLQHSSSEDLLNLNNTSVQPDSESDYAHLDWISMMIKRHVLLETIKDDDRSATMMDTPKLSQSDLPTQNDNIERRVIKRSSESTINKNDPIIKLLAAPLVPPLGFAMVAPGVCRSGHPNHANFTFLDGLKLKSIMYLCTDNYRPHTFNWAQRRGLKVFHYRIESFKDPNVPRPDQSLYSKAISNILDRRNLPILIHCNKGQSRVGTLCAILRLIQGWDESSAKSELEKFYGESAPPGRNMIWSPALNIINSNSNHSNNPQDEEMPSYLKKSQKGKEHKIFEGLARENQWEYVTQFPIELIELEPNWLPPWLSL
ncbi:tyrosine phosphatase family-domain-containing protein [Phakopsora pachyrhizi]|nr:tyrosine phosphatase family-domain-containing protein [Phakopsora pachyrhizi]